MKIAFGSHALPWLLACLSVVLGIFSARIPVLHWLSFFWMLPFVFVLPRMRLKQSIVISTFLGFVLWIGTTYWLVDANIDFAKSAAIPVAIVFLLFCLWQAIPYVMLGAAYSYFDWGKSALGPLLAASILTVLWVILPSPLPWIPQNSLYVYPKFVAVLDLSGMSLLLFLATLFCFAIEYSLRAGAAYRKQYLGLALLIPALMLGYGEIRQIQLDHDKAAAGAERWLDIGYIQPALKYDDPLDLVYIVTEQLILENSPDLIVWPEITPPYSLINSQTDQTRTLNLLNKYQQDLVAVSGYVYTEGWKKQSLPATYYNQAQLIKYGRLSGSYSKEILVPFFEYMPEPLEFLRRWMPNVLYYEAGKDQQPLSYREGIGLAMAICYEIIFPEKIRRQVNAGGNIIINPTSDAIFGGGVGGYYHLSTAYFRSIENRVPWVRSANTGISLIVDADGRPLTEASESGVVTFDSARVFVPEKTSAYSIVGDWFAVLLFVAWLLYYVLIRPGKTK